MRRLLTVLGLVGVIAIVLSLVGHFPTTKVVNWVGGTDEDMLVQARKDVAEALASGIKTLKVNITSPGGPVVTSLEIARLVRETSDQTGMIIEIHAHTICASGCTVVLASGSPGHRYIDSLTIFLVHSVQIRGANDKIQCMMFNPAPKTQDEAMGNLMLVILRDTYIKYTHIDIMLISRYLTCGNEQIGRGELAVKEGFADKVE